MLCEHINMEIIRTVSTNFTLLERRGEDKREAGREPVFKVN